MKFQAVLLTTLWWIPIFVGVAQAQTTDCSSATKNADCGKIAGCTWTSNNACVAVVHTTTHVACSDRSQGSCEDDDSCMKLKGSCVEVNMGVAIAGEACQVTLSLDSDGTPFYTEVTNKGCAEGFICSVDNSTSGVEGEIIDGLCTPTSCLGKKVPGNCNGNVNQIDYKDQCKATTQRVTICHRTCSRKNPWVRITIDEDAWSGEGCGHQLQHNVEDECKNKFPWTEWGVNHKDYLIKFHGTREYVRTSNKFSTAEEKAYWRLWEPACPYVRNGKCCDWNSTTNPCCGEPPSTATPTITHKKYVGPPGSCNATGVSTLQDVSYSAKTGSNYAYCYVTGVPSNAEECLYAVTMTDPAPVGGTKKPVNVTGDFELLCPGQVKYYQGAIVGVPVGGEGPYDSTVKGVGAKSGKTVTSKDAAAVTEIPTDVFPVVQIKKYAGPAGKCSAADLMANMKDDRYTLPTAGSSWQYCYVIAVPSTAKECLYAAKMVDKAPLGGTLNGGSINVTTGSDKLCPGNVTYIPGRTVPGLNATEGPIDATVTGTGVTSGSQVSASDAATVSPPPVIEIKKYVGPEGKCSAADLMGNMMDDTYTLPTGTSSWEYCYVISVPSTSPECLLALTMVDTAPVGGTGGTIEVTSGDEKLCPGEVKYIEGPTKVGLNATEGPINATATGTGAVSGVKVSDVDDAKVSPAPIPIIPVIEIKKYAGPPDKCSADALMANMKDDLYTLPMAGSSWQYCYKISVPSTAQECLLAVTMVDTAPLGGTPNGGSINLTTGLDKLCQGDVKYIPGGIVVGLNATEGPIVATVTGKGADSGAEVSASDAATVSPPPNPVVEIKKYAGPAGKCSADDIMNNTMLDDTYSLPAGDSSWQYCYVITVPSASTECLRAVTMVDNAPAGGTGGPIDVTTNEDQLCPSDVRYINGPTVTGLSAPEGPIDATVTGTGATSGLKVSDADDARVNPASPGTEVIPVVEIKKYAGPEGKCSTADLMGNMMDDTYTLAATDSVWQYCYVITVPSTAQECILAVKMVDQAPLGGTLSGGSIDVSGKLCPGNEVYVPGPVVKGLNTIEGPIDATVTGTGETSAKEVSAADSATVKPYVPPGELCANANPVTPQCPNDVKLMSEQGTDYSFNPISIISQDSETVTFTISNPFLSDIHAMYYQYATAVTGASKCNSEAPFTQCHDPITVTAHCMKGLSHSLAVVDVWFVDANAVDSSDHGTVPKCCQPDGQDANLPTVVYSFKVYCDTTCPSTGRRDLGELTTHSDGLGSLPKPDGILAGKLVNNAKLCSLEHHACGDSGKSVHVCHYSAKDGYQTYCVPQADSDVVAYFPKDYCGSCVGGYGIDLKM